VFEIFSTLEFRLVPFYLFIYLMVRGLELRASHLPGRHSASPKPILLKEYFQFSVDRVPDAEPVAMEGWLSNTHISDVPLITYVESLPGNSIWVSEHPALKSILTHNLWL
jgi:hypothetical protein